MNINEDRNKALLALNLELTQEGFETVIPTNKSFISPKGFVWHEVKDDHNYLSYITTSIPKFMGQTFSNLMNSKVHSAADLDEAFALDDEF